MYPDLNQMQMFNRYNRCLHAAEAPQSLLFVAEVEVFNPNLLGGDSDEGQLHLTYQGHQMGTGKMDPSSVPAQTAVKVQATMNLDLPLDFAAWRHSKLLRPLQNLQICIAAASGIGKGRKDYAFITSKYNSVYQCIFVEQNRLHFSKLQNAQNQMLVRSPP